MQTATLGCLSLSAGKSVLYGSSRSQRKFTPLLTRHLSGNNILTLSGLESAVCLEELHVAKQRLLRGQRFAIDQASINGIKVTSFSAASNTSSVGDTYAYRPGDDFEHTSCT